MKPRQTLNWGVLGSAKIARSQLIPAIQSEASSQVLALASRDASKAKEVATQLSIPQSYGGYDAVLSQNNIDAVYIPLPNSEHVKWCAQALEAGKHVLCEKPLALKTSEVEFLARLAENNNRVLAEAYMVVHHPQWHKVKELLYQNKIGDLKHIEACFSYSNFDPQNIRNQSALGGGVTRDIAGYPIALCNWLTSEIPLNITRTKLEIAPDFGIDTTISANLEYNQFSLSFYCSTQMAPRQHMIFHGSDGIIRMETPFNPGNKGKGVIHLHTLSSSQPQTFDYTQHNQYQHLIKAFSSKINGSKCDHWFSLQDSINLQRCIDELLS